MHPLDRRGDLERARHGAPDALGSRVAALEGRLLRFDESRRPRGESGGRDA